MAADFLEMFTRMLVASGDIDPGAASALWRRADLQASLAAARQLPAALVGEARTHRSAVVRAARWGVEDDPAVFAAATRFRASELLAVARNPSAPAGLLAELAGRNDPPGREAVLNPSCPTPSVLDHIATFGIGQLIVSSESAHTRIAAATSRFLGAHTDPALLIAFAGHRDADGTMVRVALGMPYITNGVARRLLTKHSAAALAIAGNPYLDSSMLSASMQASPRRVRLAETLAGGDPRRAACDPARQRALVAVGSATLDRLVVAAPVHDIAALVALTNRTGPCPGADVVAAAVEACPLDTLPQALQDPSITRLRAGERWSPRLAAWVDRRRGPYTFDDVAGAARVLGDHSEAWQIALTLFADTSQRSLTQRAQAARDVAG